MYHILTSDTYYKIDDDGCFLKYNDHEWTHPHDSWKCTGCAEMLPFGNLRMHSLSEFIAMIKSGHKWTFKNGKSKYLIRDCDHGTNRIQGNGILDTFVEN